MKKRLVNSLQLIALLVILVLISPVVNSACQPNGVWLQVLGSGGPELDDGRASASYLVWRDGKARLLIDMGGGSAQRFEESGANLNDLDVILFTHFLKPDSGHF